MFPRSKYSRLFGAIVVALILVSSLIQLDKRSAGMLAPAIDSDPLKPDASLPDSTGSPGGPDLSTRDLRRKEASPSIKIAEAGATQVMVLEADGTLATRATLIASPMDGEGQVVQRVQWSPDHRDLVLEPGLWSVVAEAYPKPLPSVIHFPDPVTSKAQVIAIPSQPGTQAPIFVLSPETWLVVHAVALGQPSGWNTGYLKLLPSTDGNQPTPQELTDAPALGQFDIRKPCLLSNLPLGKYRIGLSLTSLGPLVADTPIEITKGGNRVEFPMDWSSIQNYLIVRCFGPDGRPMAANGFDLDYDLEGSRSGSIGGGMEAAQGGVQVIAYPDALCRIDTASIRAMELTLTHPDFATKHLHLRPGERELRVHFARPVDLHLSVFSNQLQHRKNIHVQIHRLHQAGRRSFGTGQMIDALGKCTFIGLEQGEYELRVSLRTTGRTYSDEYWPVARESVSVLPGEQAYRLTVPVIHSATVSAPAETPGARVHILDPIDNKPFALLASRSLFLDKDKNVVVKALPAGIYEVRAGASKGVLTVPGEGVVLRP